MSAWRPPADAWTRRDALRNGFSSLALLCTIASPSALRRTSTEVTSAALRAQARSPFEPFQRDLPIVPSCCRSTAPAPRTTTRSRSARVWPRSCPASRRRSTATRASIPARRSAPARAARSSCASATRCRSNPTCICTAATCPRSPTGTRWTSSPRAARSTTCIRTSRTRRRSGTTTMRTGARRRRSTTG